MEMKLLTIAVPCYNSQAYMAHAIDSLLSGGEEVEILIIDDGSADHTGRIADDYERRYPGIIRALHQENGGHGGAVMTGLHHAAGKYFKVVDSDDWVDEKALREILNTLRAFENDPVDLLVSNYIYDKAGEKHKHVVSYRNALPQHRVFGWEEAKHFRRGQYLLMHAVIYRTRLLRECGLELPRHTFYVDDLYVYVPLKNVQRLYYLDVDFYHYFIGRADQSVQEKIMLQRVDQYLRVNRLLVSSVDPFSVSNRQLREYMIGFLEIITTVSSVLLIRDGKEASLGKKQELWAFIEAENPQVYRRLRRRLLGRLVHLPGWYGRMLVNAGYRVSRKIFGFN